jgi:beta-glucosidase
MDAGVQVGGYFVWSLLDNLEWTLGYRMRFGLVHVDYPGRQRVVKDSGWWYRDLIASQPA